MLLVDIHHNLILHLVLMHIHIRLRYQQIGSLLMIEFFYEFIVSLVEVLRSFNRVEFRSRGLIELLRILLLWLDSIFVRVDEILVGVEFLIHLAEGS